MVDEFNRGYKWETDRSLSGLSADRMNGANTALWTLCLMLDRERAFSSGQWHNGREKVQCIVTEEEGRTYASFENRRLREVGMYIFLPRTFGPNRVSVAPPTLPPPRIIYLTRLVNARRVLPYNGSSDGTKMHSKFPPTFILIPLSLDTFLWSKITLDHSKYLQHFYILISSALVDLWNH